MQTFCTAIGEGRAIVDVNYEWGGDDYVVKEVLLCGVNIFHALTEDQVTDLEFKAHQESEKEYQDSLADKGEELYNERNSA